MRKFVYWCFVLSMLFVSCGKDENKVVEPKIESYSFSINPTSVQLGKNAGAFTIIVKSNQSWSVSLNNTGSGITGLRLGNTSGYGDGSVTVYYDGVSSQYYQESGTILFHHKITGGYSEITTCNCYRRNLPRW